MRGRGLQAIILGLGLATLTLPVAGHAEVRVYPVRHRTAEELLPVARAALAGQGSAEIDARTNALLLVGEAPVLRRTLEVLAQQDRRLRTIRVEYESLGHDALEATGVRIDWGVGSGAVRVGTVAVPGGGVRVRVVPEAVRETGEPRLAGTLALLEGHSGRIALGRELPLRTRSGWLESTLWVSAQSGFEVTPRLLGDGRVRLALVPFEAQVRAGHVIETSGGALTLEVEPGRTLAVGRITRDDATRAVDPFSGFLHEQRRQERVLLVTVHVE